jgi:hypothetical protein
MPPKVHKCSLCNFESDKKYHFDSHCNTQKHKRNGELINDNKSDRIIKSTKNNDNNSNTNHIQSTIINNSESNVTRVINNIKYNCDEDSKQILETLNQYFNDIKPLTIPKDYADCYKNISKETMIIKLSVIDCIKDKKTHTKNINNMANIISDIIFNHQCKHKYYRPIYSHVDNFFVRSTTDQNNIWLIDKNAKLLESKYIVHLIKQLNYFSETYMNREIKECITNILVEHNNELKTRIVHNLKTLTEISYIELIDIHNNKQFYQDNVLDSDPENDYTHTYLKYNTGKSTYELEGDRFVEHISKFNTYANDINLLERELTNIWCKIIIERQSFNWNDRVIKQGESCSINYVKTHDLKSSIDLIKPFIKHVVKVLKILNEILRNMVN